MYIFFIGIIVIILLCFLTKANTENKKPIIKSGYEFNWEQKYIDNNEPLTIMTTGIDYEKFMEAFSEKYPDIEQEYRFEEV